jgi:glucose/arabinose dehydrogenase
MLGARVWRAVAIALVAVGTSACSDDGMSADPPADLADQIQLPPGFRISIWADNIIRPRSLTMGDEGTVFAGSYFFTKGVTSPIYALRDDDGDGDADQVWTLSNDMGTPNGIDYHDGALYVVDEHRVMRIDDVEQNLDNPTFVTINSELPSREDTDRATNVGHWWRYLRYRPDDKIYVTVGTRWSFLVGAHTANDITDPAIYSTIVRMNPDGSDLEIFADGVRNSMGMDFHPTRWTRAGRSRCLRADPAFGRRR